MQFKIPSEVHKYETNNGQGIQGNVNTIVDSELELGGMICEWTVVRNCLNCEKADTRISDKLAFLNYF